MPHGNTVQVILTVASGIAIACLRQVYGRTLSGRRQSQVKRATPQRQTKALAQCLLRTELIVVHEIQTHELLPKLRIEEDAEEVDTNLP